MKDHELEQRRDVRISAGVRNIALLYKGAPCIVLKRENRTDDDRKDREREMRKRGKREERVAVGGVFHFKRPWGFLSHYAPLERSHPFDPPRAPVF